jgi:ubiquinone/menaquinone biosynthesis C-methylase UbiE
MTFEYQETTEDLATRINIHEKYGTKDIDKWMLEVLAPKKGSIILDVGCGAGKQLKAFYEYLEGEAEITGGDVSEELLNQANNLNTELGDNLTITELDFNKPFGFDDESFDLLSCCFAIYYAADIPFTIREMHRVLKPGGRLFSTGPMPENKQLFYDVIREATEKPIPPMPGSSRYASEILDSIRATFSSVNVHIFENPLVFENLQPFMDYTRASLSEDRKLWKDFFEGDDEFEDIMTKISVVAKKKLEKSDQGLVMTKVVGGFIAHK